MNEFVKNFGGYQPTGKAPDELHPPTGGSGVQHPFTINNEPLSTKQLHEVIVSQSMTIDTAMTRQGELVDALKRIRDMLQEGESYKAWIEINKVLG